MEAEVPTTQWNEDKILARRSWTGYLRTCIGNGLIILISLSFALDGHLIALLVTLGSAGRLAYMILWHRSHILYSNEVGVWLSFGVVPWNKGVYGVKWRDLDVAGYYPNFISWLTKSYTIRVGHRYTKSSELTFEHAYHGDQAAFTINQDHVGMVHSGALA